MKLALDAAAHPREAARVALATVRLSTPLDIRSLETAVQSQPGEDSTPGGGAGQAGF